MPPLPIGACEVVRQSHKQYGVMSFGPSNKFPAQLATTRSNSSKAESKRYQNTIAEEEDEIVIKPKKQINSDRHHLRP